VTHATLDDSGAIASVGTKEGETIAADLFVDCTGFTGLLIDKALHTPFVSFANNLFNDAAVALPSPIGTSIPSETVSTALRHGWAWRIPLTGRFGNGYVYSTQFCSADAAETELRQHLGLLEPDTPARHLKMRIGRVTKHWKTNTRTDTEYWRANAANLNLSDDLKRLYSAWMSGKSIVPGVRQQVIGKGYPVFSWYSIMTGMGIFPDPAHLRPPSSQEARYNMAEIDNLLSRSRVNYPAHRHALARIAPRRTDESLQIYLW
jgi:tryptophan halogenase